MSVVVRGAGSAGCSYPKIDIQVSTTSDLVCYGHLYNAGSKISPTIQRVTSIRAAPGHLRVNPRKSTPSSLPVLRYYDYRHAQQRQRGAARAQTATSLVVVQI